MTGVTNALRKWRIGQGMTQAEVAELLSVNQSHVARFENGVLIPNRRAMAAIFEMTGGQVTANDFHHPPDGRIAEGQQVIS
jgi:transcriptional regulator with XRE-family HTH domain